METNIIDSFFALFDSNKRIYWLYIVSSALIAAVYLVVYKKQRRVNLSAKLWLHKSAVLDYKYFVLSFFIKTILIVPVVISINEVSIFVYELLLDSYGYVRITSFSYMQVMILFTLSLFVVSDFTRYWLHRLLHTVPFLWEFHKVHHSAKVLTPITFYRVHPLENILFGFRYALSIGAVSGIFIYFFGAMIDILDVVGVNVLLFVFSLAGSNLRHSHIKLRYPDILEQIFISPFAHQLHHSTKYFNKNFGGYLAIWDNLFGTLQKSKEVIDSKQTIKFGVQIKDFQTLGSLLFVPFFNIYKTKKGKQNAK
jgi:sterol desaturase/sphingolipid hydroxylase (fatty acid hydroxylase superfamily)